VIDIIGEGKTDVPQEEKPHPPDQGVVPILVSKLCGQPKHLFVRTRQSQIPFLIQKNSLAQKVRFARRQARISQSAGLVFVVDSDGDWKGKYTELAKGRDMDQVPEFPTALGVAHPRVEARLLADADAIRRAFGLPQTPAIPERPEALPASKKDKNHPKNVLKAAAGKSKVLSAEEKTQIAGKMTDTDLLKQRCQMNFAPFAKEVEDRIRPLFQ